METNYLEKIIFPFSECKTNKDFKSIPFIYQLLGSFYVTRINKASLVCLPTSSVFWLSAVIGLLRSWAPNQFSSHDFFVCQCLVLKVEEVFLPAMHVLGWYTWRRPFHSRLNCSWSLPIWKFTLVTFLSGGRGWSPPWTFYYFKFKI